MCKTLADPPVWHRMAQTHDKFVFICSFNLVHHFAEKLHQRLTVSIHSFHNSIMTWYFGGLLEQRIFGLTTKVSLPEDMLAESSHLSQLPVWSTLSQLVGAYKLCISCAIGQNSFAPASFCKSLQVFE